MPSTTLNLIGTKHEDRSKMTSFVCKSRKATYMQKIKTWVSTIIVASITGDWFRLTCCGLPVLAKGGKENFVCN